MLNVTVLLKFYKGEISPFDESALECALSMEDASITLVAMAPLSVKERLLALTRLGDVKAVLIADEKYRGSDTLATAKVLSRAISELKPDLVLCGRQSMDGDTAQVPAQVATLLGYDLITNAMDFSLDKINTRLGKSKVNLPAVISVERIKNLRFPSLRSKTKTLEVWDNDRLKLSSTEVGLNGSKTKVLKVFDKEKSQRKCKFVSSKELKSIILDGLKKEKISVSKAPSENKLDKIFIIGLGVLDTAKSLAKEVEIVDGESAEEISKILKEKKAKHVLFEATLKNRTLAPKVSAILDSGLAADCIGVETDGKNLFVYRPANCESVVAKIGFTDGIEMATVRCVKNSDDLIFSVGYGAKDYLTKIEDFAKKFDGKITSSRKIVDNGVLGYEYQVGLTGKIVSPKVYVAMGISGEIQHVVGFENATTVIAINKDKNAKIFDYADYGVVEDIKNVEL